MRGLLKKEERSRRRRAEGYLKQNNMKRIDLPTRHRKRKMARNQRRGDDQVVQMRSSGWLSSFVGVMVMVAGRQGVERQRQRVYCALASGYAFGHERGHCRSTCRARQARTDQRPRLTRALIIIIESGRDGGFWTVSCRLLGAGCLLGNTWTRYLRLEEAGWKWDGVISGWPDWRARCTLHWRLRRLFPLGERI